MCLAKFDLAGHMLSLSRKCPVTGHYHEPCLPVWGGTHSEF